MLEKAGASLFQGNALYAATLAGGAGEQCFYYSVISAGNKSI
jgi:hypothetical protein